MADGFPRVEDIKAVTQSRIETEENEGYEPAAKALRDLLVWIREAENNFSRVENGYTPQPGFERATVPPPPPRVTGGPKPSNR